MMMKQTITPYDYWLASLCPVSHEKRRQVCERIGGAERFYSLTPDQLAGLHLFSEKETAHILKAQRECPPDEMWRSFTEQAKKSGMRFIPYHSPDYPERLKQIYNAPYALFVMGRLPEEGRKSVAVVGARSCSEYGRSVAQALGRVLAEHGVPVISGMALGVDSASHAGALSAGGDTFAVLGGGCDVCYPRSSRTIYENILSGQGGILSEQLPGTQPKPLFFPMRNRIISGLADILIVVEARERSGSLITADLALEQGKDVYAVPGRYLDQLSVGCNRLIEQGAGIFVDMDSFLRNIGVVQEEKHKRADRASPALSPEAEQVWRCLELSAKYLDQITEESGLSLLSVLAALDELKRNDLAQETVQNYFIRKI